MDAELPSTLDDALDRLLRGERVDVDGFLAAHPDLNLTEREDLRALGEAVGSSTQRGTPDLLGPSDDVEGRSLGEFRLIRRLGSGGMGHVFLAEQASLKREVAIKVLRPSAELSVEVGARFVREAETLAKLRHPNIVTAFAFGEDEGVRWLAMEFVPGRGLHEVFKDARAGGPRPSIPQIVTWCRDIARALECAHAAGVIHRDVKPSNIQITPEGQAVLVDFGLAQDQPDSSLTLTGAFRGSPRYASPEQVDPAPGHIDARTDVYSLGVTLYEGVTGRVPFEGATTEQLFAQILEGDAPAPREVEPSVPREVETVIVTAIEKDKSRRYPTATAFANDLDALLEMRDILAQPPGVTRRLRKWARHHRVGAALVAAAMLVLLVLGAVAVERAWQAARERERAVGEAIAEARARLDSFRDLRARAQAAATELAALRTRVFGEPLPAEDLRRYGRGDGDLTALQLVAESTFFSVIDSVNVAARLDPSGLEHRQILADLYMEKWRDALRAGDTVLLSTYRALVEKDDVRGAHGDELAGTGRVTIETTPAGGEAFLFRFLEQSTILPGGARRLVPVPIGGTPAIVPGAWCLRVVKGAGDVGIGDLIDSVGGWPIEGTVLVAEATPPLRRLDRLVSIDGRMIRDAFDARSLEEASAESRTERTFVFDHEGSRLEMMGESVEALGIRLRSPEDVAREGGVPAHILSNGHAHEAVLPRGLDVRTTATPLLCSPNCSAGATPVRARPLPPGSYVALIRKSGFEDQRLPFVIPRGESVTVTATLLSLGTTPEGFAYVPPGLFRKGPPSASGGGKPLDVPGFWMMEREVTVREYLEFLNDPGVDTSVKDQLTKARNVPHDIGRGNPVPTDLGAVVGRGLTDRVERRDDGVFIATERSLDLPLSGCSWRHADAYAKWVNNRARSQGRNLVFALPREVEWEKAARGVDGRAYPAGDLFNPLWYKSGYSRSAMILEPPRSFPVDESPYSIYDLAGSLREWCEDETADRSGNPEGYRSIRGSAYETTSDEPLWLNMQFRPSSRHSMFGFRLVARP